MPRGSEIRASLLMKTAPDENMKRKKKMLELTEQSKMKLKKKKKVLVVVAQLKKKTKAIEMLCWSKALIRTKRPMHSVRTVQGSVLVR